MKKIGATLFAVTAIFAGACGDDSNSDGDTDADNNDNDTDADSDNDNDIVIPDADGSDDIDAPPDSPVLPAGCDWLENNDAGNGISAAGAWEVTGLNLATTVTACGSVNNNFEPGMNGELGVVDIDAFTFNITADSDVFVSLSGTGLETAPNLTGFVAYINEDGGLSTAAVLPFYGNHGASIASLSAAVATEYFLIVQSLNDVAATPTANYKFRVAVEATRPCPTAAGAAQYTEANDGAANTGNDVLLIGSDITLTPATDAPEVSGITVAPAGTYKISGSSAAQDVVTTDAYYDGDVFEFTTGATTDQARLRLSWPTTAPAADVDMYLFEKSAVATEVPLLVDTAGATVENPEFAAPALKPNTTYWLYVGGYEDNLNQYPRTYDVQICGETFVAP